MPTDVPPGRLRYALLGSGAPGAILAIGDELLAGEVQDKNGAFLAAALTDAGFRLGALTILPDEVDTLASALRRLLSAHDVVVITGGLGPTSDDVTTEAVCAALDRGVRRDAAAWQAIERRFARRGVSLPPGNEKQADVPEGAEVLPNPRGTASGYLLSGLPPRPGGAAGGLVAVLPGPPRENQPMFRESVLPRLRAVFAEMPAWRTRVLRVFGLPESEVGARLGDLEARHPGVRLGYQAHFPEILVKLRGPDDANGRDRIAEAAKDVRARLGAPCYGEGEARLPEVLGRWLARAGLRMVTAESCTAGLCAKLLTDAPGSSAWLEAGFVTYSNEAKVSLLRVSPALLAAEGAVSEPVAQAMLQGALQRSGAQVGVAITGIAGPDGGSAKKPVGTVCIAWGSADSLRVRTHRFPFDRDRNRTVSAWAALGHLLRALPHLAPQPAPT
jgi:competence/damage-inducible protein CinA C-terminal domain